MVICEPEGKIPLITFIPPSEFRIVRHNFDDDRPPAEARLLVFNPLSVTNAPEFRVNQMHVVLESKLLEICSPLYLIQDDLELTFPREYYATDIERFTVPILG